MAKTVNIVEPRKGSRWIPVFVTIYILLQLVIPLRHVLYKRDLEWTHEGSNFAWRMMADHHETNGSITIEDPSKGDIYLHSADKFLSKRQLVMVNNPYTLLQYVHFLERYLEQEAMIPNPIIKVDIQVSVNGKPFRAMFDPTCNLSEADYSPFRDLKWVFPSNDK